MRVAVIGNVNYLVRTKELLHHTVAIFTACNNFVNFAWAVTCIVDILKKDGTREHLLLT